MVILMMGLMILGTLLIGSAVIDISKTNKNFGELSITLTSVIILIWLLILSCRIRLRRARLLEKMVFMEEDLRRFVALTRELQKIVDTQQRQLKSQRHQERRQNVSTLQRQGYASLPRFPIRDSTMV